MLSERALSVYRAARREGYRPADALSLARPPILPEFIGEEEGTFTFDGIRFDYRIEWDDNCLCQEPDSDVSAEDYEHITHRIIGVTVHDRDDWSWLGSVCGDTRTWLGALADERYVADRLVDMACEARRNYDVAQVGPDQLSLI